MMFKIKSEKIKTKYSTFENTVYLIKNIWKWDEGLFLLCFLQIPMIVICPLLAIYMPKLVIDSVSSHVSKPMLIVNIGLPALGIVILNVLLRVFSDIIRGNGCSYRAKYMELF